MQHSRRTFLKGLGVGALATMAGGATEQQRPNVLVIQPDQHRGTIMGCAGDLQVKTPNLDQLAAEGVRFSQCASASPVCSPFRASFQTGLYPHKHGVIKNNLRLKEEFICFPEVFEAAGYATGYIGKWHLDGGIPKVEGGEGVTPSNVGGFVPPERRQGWQEWFGYEKSHEFFEVWKYNDAAEKVRVEGYDWEPAWHTDMAVDFIKRNTKDHKPWLYYLAYGPPHVPEECPDTFLNMYDPDAFELPPDIAGRLSADKEQELRRILQMYYAQVTAIDHEVGRLLDSLKELGIDENTIILYTSDHGDVLGSHYHTEDRLRGKAVPYSTAFRIPLIIRWPKQVEAGCVCEALASGVDLAPTLLELAGLPALPDAQGDSLAGWALHGDGPKRDGLWIGLKDWRAVWTGRYLYARGMSQNHLFDYVTDPHEMNNLFEAPEHKDTQKRLHGLLVDLARENGDPMLQKLEELA